MQKITSRTPPAHIAGMARENPDVPALHDGLIGLSVLRYDRAPVRCAPLLKRYIISNQRSKLDRVVKFVQLQAYFNDERYTG